MSVDASSQDILDRENFHADEGASPAREKISQFEEDALWDRSEQGAWKTEFLTQFVRNQLRVAPTMPILTAMFAFTCMSWVPIGLIIFWLSAALACQGGYIYLCQSYLKKSRSQNEQHDWIGMLSASEFTQGVCWTMPLFLFWPSANSLQGAVLVAFVMAVVAVRLLVVNNFIPVLIAGTGIMTVGLAARCAMQPEPVYMALGSFIIVLEAFFIYLARQLAATARDMVKFRSQKDELIKQLRFERDKAEGEKLKAIEASKAKSVFLATMSHELRTPLNAIMGFSEVINREMFGPVTVSAYREYAGDIHHSGRYLLDLINDILDLSRIEAGRREIVEEPFNILSCVNSALALLGAKARERSISIVVEIDNNLPKLMGDIRAVNQIFINLLTNATKFTPKGGEIRVSAALNMSGAMIVTFKDNGAGIPVHEIRAVLDSFQRGSFATKQAIDGAGLGLPIVKGLMDLHGGELDIKSAPGDGTEVLVTFPAHRVLAGPRGEVLSDPEVQSESQRRLIAITG
jgi:two-component system, cell cycle sensor histidine kinase PleC